MNGRAVNLLLMNSSTTPAAAAVFIGAHDVAVTSSVPIGCCNFLYLLFARDVITLCKYFSTRSLSKLVDLTASCAKFLVKSWKRRRGIEVVEYDTEHSRGYLLVLVARPQSVAVVDDQPVEAHVERLP